MQIDHDLQTCALRPVKCATKPRVRALYVWIALTRHNAPVANRDPHVVEASALHLLEVVLGDPRIPMLLQQRLRRISSKLLCECVLVDSTVALEDRRCDPRLEDEPAASVDTANLLIVVVEGQTALERCSLPLVSILDANSLVFCCAYMGEAEASASKLTTAAEK